LSNAVSSFILATSLRLALNHVDRSSLIKNLANDIDKVSDANLGKRSEKLQEDMVRLILLPLAKELMKENIDGYKALLMQETEPYRLFRENDDRGQSESRQNFQPKHG